MKRFALLITLAFSLSTLGGCAAMMQQWRETNCNYNGGYSAGMNAANKGEDMKPGFANACNPEDREATMKGYRKGYRDAIQSRQAPPPPADYNQGGGININIR